MCLIGAVVGVTFIKLLQSINYVLWPNYDTHHQWTVQLTCVVLYLRRKALLHWSAFHLSARAWYKRTKATQDFFFFEKTFNRTSCLVFINANFFGIIVSWSNQAQHKLNRILTWTIEDIYFFGMSNFVASILTHLGLSLINSLLSFLLGSWFVGQKLQKVVFYPNIICSSSKLNLESFQYKTKHYCCISDNPNSNWNQIIQ